MYETEWQRKRRGLQGELDDARAVKSLQERELADTTRRVERLEGEVKTLDTLGQQHGWSPSTPFATSGEQWV